MGYKLLIVFWTKKDIERRSFDGLDPDLLSYIGLGSSPFIRPQEDKFFNKREMGFSRKRHALFELNNRPIKAFL